MPQDPNKPLLRLNDPKPTTRRNSGGGGARNRSFERIDQIAKHGPIFRHLRNVLDADNPALALHADPNSLAPERLLVLEVTGSIQNFSNAVARVIGLEFIGEEELKEDEFDKNPELYMLVPQLSALREILSLWEGWEKTGTVPRNYTPWRDLFTQLKAIRLWGPSDRVSPQNRAYFTAMIDEAPDSFLIRIEVELVFRQTANSRKNAEDEITKTINTIGGTIINRALHTAFAYHASWQTYLLAKYVV